MNVAIHTSALRGYDLARTVEICAELEYGSVELAADISETPHFQSHLATEADLEALADLLDRTNLKLPAIDIGGFDSALCLVNLDDAERRAAVRNVAHSIRVAGELLCPLVTSHLWGLPAAEARLNRSACEASFLESVAELAPVLVKQNVHLNFMPHPGGFIEESDDTVDLIRRTGSPFLGYTYGTGHSFVINRPGQTPAEMIRYAGDLLTHVLVSDSHHVERIIAPPEVKAHEHTVPGSGDLDFSAVFAALREICYDRTLSVHLISERDRIKSAARSTREFLLNCLS